MVVQIRERKREKKGGGKRRKGRETVRGKRRRGNRGREGRKGEEKGSELQTRLQNVLAFLLGAVP